MVGKASYGRQSFSGGGGYNWFYIEDNKDNVYRVLPPMHSLAASGKYAKYYKTHRGFRGTDNKQKPFICIEEQDYKTKLIKTHCPICDYVAELKAEIPKYQARGATPEQIKQFNNTNIFPLQSEKKFYLNVVNQENKIGILAIGTKQFNALEALAMQHEKSGRDITGMEGVYLNFKKLTKYKGDKDAVFSVEVFMQPSSDGAFRYVTHTMTPEFSSRLKKEAADLGNLFKSFSVEQLASIVALEGEARAKYVDSLFAAPESEAQMSAQIPNTNLQAVSRVEVNSNGGFQVQQPTVPAGYGSVNPNPAPANAGQFQGTQTVTPTAAVQTAQDLVPGKAMSSLNDDEFLAMVKPQRRG